MKWFTAVLVILIVGVGVWLFAADDDENDAGTTPSPTITISRSPTPSASISRTPTISPTISVSGSPTPTITGSPTGEINFSRRGTLAINDEGMKPDTWYFVYTRPDVTGSRSYTAELTLDTNTTCVIQGSTQPCDTSLSENMRVRVQGFFTRDVILVTRIETSAR